MTFELAAPPRLSRATVERDEPLRLDAERLRGGWSKARVLPVDPDGRAPVQRSGEGWAINPRSSTGDAPPPDAVLLGEQDGTAYWTVRGRPSLIDTESSASGTSIGAEDPADWQDLRARGADLDATSAGLLVTAVAVLNWHDNARFCSRCGSHTETGHAGWQRTCTRCGHTEYPRTDPAIICLVHDGGTGDSARVLLARQPVWPEGRFTVLAGFVEAGESLEACVHREIGEEVGVDVTDVRYLGSQAWPFPRSVMIGFEAVGDPEQPVRPADGEIAEAFWITRAQLRQALDHGDWMTGGGHPLLLPPPVSIARSMLDSWAAVED